MNILGISAFYHDSAACLVRDGGALTGIVTRYDVVRMLTGAAS